jgi:hypothetical protein
MRPDRGRPSFETGAARPPQDEAVAPRIATLNYRTAWYAWLKDSWVRIPPEKIVQDHAPDGQPYLFMLAGTVQCFVRPKGGLRRFAEGGHDVTPPRSVHCE